MRAILFTAPWCSFCNRLKPHIQKYDIEYLNVDIEENMNELKKLGVQTIPTLVVYDDTGELVTKLVNPNPIQVSKALE